jgi:hypothetical protein
VRHSKRCSPSPTLSLRQKSCWPCANSKSKCNLELPKCSGCVKRGMLCDYAVRVSRGSEYHRPSPQEGAGDLSRRSETNTKEGLTNLGFAAKLLPIPGYSPLSVETMQQLPKPLEPWLLETASSGENLTIDSLFATFASTYPSQPVAGLSVDILADMNRPTEGWNDSPVLNYYSDPFSPFEASQVVVSSAMVGSNPVPEPTLPSSAWLQWPNGPTHNAPLVRHSMQTLLRVIKTWPHILAKGFQTPPVLHHTHSDPITILQPIQDCITITKAWSAQTVHTTETVRNVIIREMRSLFSSYRTLDERHLLAALQALTMYTIMLMYPGFSQLSVSLVDPSVFLCLQKVISYISNTGLILTQERDNVRPSWESWIHITAKRRAVFSLYLVHWSYAVYHDIECFACSQLGFMPAPAPKFLWHSQSQLKWESLYDRWLEQWQGAPYMMHEFDTIQDGTNLERRAELWLEDADELGVLFFSIGKNMHLCLDR